MDSRFLVVTFTEDEFSTIEEFGSEESATAYASGFVDGAYCYGAGSAIAVVWPRDAEELDEDMCAIATQEVSQYLERDREDA